jgi:hypothetical protein
MPDQWEPDPFDIPGVVFIEGDDFDPPLTGSDTVYASWYDCVHDSPTYDGPMPEGDELIEHNGHTWFWCSTHERMEQLTTSSRVVLQRLAVLHYWLLRGITERLGVIQGILMRGEEDYLDAVDLISFAHSDYMEIDDQLRHLSNSLPDLAKSALIQNILEDVHDQPGVVMLPNGTQVPVHLSPDEELALSQDEDWSEVVAEARKLLNLEEDL